MGAKPKFPNPPPRGEANWAAKLKNEDVRMIRQLAAHGNLLQRELAAMFNVSRRNIGAIIALQTWTHL